MATDNILFQDIFDIKDLDPQGKRFDRGNLQRIATAEQVIYMSK
jgi:hypothetical protein